MILFIQEIKVLFAFLNFTNISFFLKPLKFNQE